MCIIARKFKFKFSLVLLIPFNIHSYPTIDSNTSCSWVVNSENLYLCHLKGRLMEFIDYLLYYLVLILGFDTTNNQITPEYDDV